MTASAIKYQPNLVQDRVNASSLLSEIIVCSLCHGILWIPVACQTCETPYCLSCIKNWQMETPESDRCPNNCSQFVQRRCPLAVSHILNILQVVCSYKANGCNETLPYNNLQTHEETCGYRLLVCSGCKGNIIKQDFRDHHDSCSLVSLTCPECETVYQRQDEENHTETICLRVQVHQLRDRMKKIEDKSNGKLDQNNSLM